MLNPRKQKPGMSSTTRATLAYSVYFRLLFYLLAFTNYLCQIEPLGLVKVTYTLFIKECGGGEGAEKVP